MFSLFGATVLLLGLSLLSLVYKRYVLDEDYFTEKYSIFVNKYAWSDILDVKIHDYYPSLLYMIALKLLLNDSDIDEYRSVVLVLKNPTEAQDAKYQKSGFHVRVLSDVMKNKQNVQEVFTLMNEYREEYG